MPTKKEASPADQAGDAHHDKTQQVDDAVRAGPRPVKLANLVPVHFPPFEWAQTSASGDPIGSPQPRKMMGVRTLAQHREEQETQRRADPLYGCPLIKKRALIGAAAIGAEAARKVAYIWEGIATPGAVIVMAGPPGEGKTTAWALLFASRRNPTGEPMVMFGRALHPAPKDKWLVMIENEQGGSLTSRQLVRSVEMLGLPPATLERVIVLAREEVKAGSQVWEELCDLTRHGHVDSIWIDSLARFQPGGDSNREEDQAEVFAAVAECLEDAPDVDKPTCWMLAHTRKNNGGKGDLLADISGSVQRAAQVDVAVLFRAEKDESMAVVSSTAYFAKIRDGGDEHPAPSTFAIKKGPDRWSLSWGEPPAKKSEDGKAPAHDRLRAYFEDHPGSTKSAAKKALGMNNETVDGAIRVLFAERRLRSRKKTVRGVEQTVFELTGRGFAEVLDGAKPANDDPEIVPF